MQFYYKMYWYRKMLGRKVYGRKVWGRKVGGGVQNVWAQRGAKWSGGRKVWERKVAKHGWYIIHIFTVLVQPIGLISL